VFLAECKNAHPPYRELKNHRKVNASLPRETEPDQLTLEAAVEIINKKRAAPPRKKRRKKKRIDFSPS